MNIASPYAALPPRLTVQEALYLCDDVRHRSTAPEIAALLETMDIDPYVIPPYHVCPRAKS